MQYKTNKTWQFDLPKACPPFKLSVKVQCNTSLVKNSLKNNKPYSMIFTAEYEKSVTQVLETFGLPVKGGAP